MTTLFINKLTSFISGLRYMVGNTNWGRYRGQLS